MSTLKFKKVAGTNEYESDAVTATGSAVVLHVEMEQGRSKGGAVVRVQHSLNGTGWTTCARYRTNDAVEEVTVGGLLAGQKVRMVLSGATPEKMEALA